MRTPVVLRHQLPFALETYIAALRVSPVLQRLGQQVLPAKWQRFVASALLRAPSIHVVFEHLTNLHNAAACCRTADALGVQSVHLITRQHTHSSLCADILLGSSDTTTSSTPEHEAEPGALRARAEQAWHTLRQHGPTRRVSKASDALVGSDSASSGAARWLTIHQHTSTDACLQQLRQRFGVEHVFASDLSSSSVPIARLALPSAYMTPHSDDTGGRHVQLDVPSLPAIALVFGNEQSGISDTVRTHATQCFHLPMVGMVESLNLSVAFGMTLYHLELVGALRAHLTTPSDAPRSTPPTTACLSEHYTHWLNQVLEQWVAQSITHGERVRQQLRASLES